MEISNFNDFVTMAGDKLVTDSQKVARHFGRHHKTVLHLIRTIGCSAEFSRLNFMPRDYIDSRGKVQPLYTMTKNGFMLLVMGFTGKAAMKIKEAYIGAFDAMAEFIQTGSKYVVQEAVNAKAALIAQNEVGSFHGCGLCRHKYDKPPKVKRFQLALDKLQSLQLSLPLAA